MSKRVQHNRPTKVAMYSDCELTTGFPISSAGNSRIVTAHLPQRRISAFRYFFSA
jgi:hypothetical protein